MGKSCLNATIYFAHEVFKMSILFKFAIPKDKNDKDFQTVLINSNVNVCKLINGVVGDFLSRMILDDLKKSSQNKLQCPIPQVRNLIDLRNVLH